MTMHLWDQVAMTFNCLRQLSTRKRGHFIKWGACIECNFTYIKRSNMSYLSIKERILLLRILCMSKTHTFRYTFLYVCLCMLSLAPPSAHPLDSVASCWTTKAPRLCQRASTYLLASYLPHFFYSGVCNDSTTVSTGSSALTRVKKQAWACARHLISVPVNWCVSCTEKDKNNMKEQKGCVSLPCRSKITC